MFTLFWLATIELWKNVVNEAKEAKELGSRLLLGCHMHQNITEIQKPEDFKNKSPTGTKAISIFENLLWNH